MRINSINSCNFRGIFVSKKNNPKEKIRQKQALILQEYDSENRTIGRKIGKQQKAIEKSIEDISSMSYPGRFSNPTSRREFVEQKEQKIKELDSMVRENAKAVKSRAIALQDTVEQVNKADRRVINDKSNTKVSVDSSTPNKNTGFSKIVGYDYEKGVLYDNFISKVIDEKNGAKVDIPNAILFFGPYSNGKTLITKSVAQETGCKIRPARVPAEEYENLQEYVKYFEKAEQDFQKTGARTIIFIDELDTYINNETPIKDELINLIKNCSKDYHCTVFAATNNPLDLGVDFNDTDIFPIRMSIEPSDSKTKIDILKHYLQGYNKEELDYDRILEAIEEKEKETGLLYSNGGIEMLCMMGLGYLEKYDTITTDDIIEYINSNKEVKLALTPEMLEKFKNDCAIVMNEGK